MKLKELAAHLGLSQTTVSRALNGYPEVNEETRRRVLDAARRYDYRPNASARRLATGFAGAIGVVLLTDRNLLLDPHYVEFLAGLGERLAQHETDIVMTPVRSADEVTAYRRLAGGTRVDAVVLSSPTLADERIRVLSDLGLPFLLHGRTETDVPHAWLDIDNEGAFRHATKHLIDLGHRRIGLVNGDPRLTFARDRERGFREALLQAGLGCDERLIGTGALTDEIGFRITARLLSERPRPTALLVSSMMMSLGAFRAIRAAGLELGRDVSMIAHDDVFPFLNPDAMVPTMSTTRSSIRAAGVRCAELLGEVLAGRDPATIRELWPVELIVRASTGPAPSGA
ncbi:LacI family DNA-binding transcriptional regulator [Prosthecomicrobium pneumaticum]|uniref:LacI family transcriptional regulator n=1 Tax=Prosthecomicrobium pneumaticum TaxID=81895 RepID=A0A7W9FM32_9HYPH|nr:LacI family DNA-binding transcriptional regulator [Prosthecomicrobium pneumaticum]MBB5753164.1 LacI family transcriptional regulator [Prosthecomicrobium pneumaticum]